MSAFTRRAADQHARSPKYVKDWHAGVKEPSRAAPVPGNAPSVGHMTALAFVLFTIAIFALLGFAQKLIER
jgi:hypothetical protein